MARKTDKNLLFNIEGMGQLTGSITREGGANGENAWPAEKTCSIVYANATSLPSGQEHYAI